MKDKRGTWGFGLLGLMLLLVGSVLFAGQRRQLGEGIVVRPIHDFGTVNVGADIVRRTHTFELHNRSRQPVKIEKVISTCRCTDVAAEEEIIPPGGVGHVTATLQLANSGTQSADVSVITDCPDQPMIRLRLRAHGRSNRRLAVAPQYVRIDGRNPKAITLLFADFESDEPPPAPEVSGAGGLEWQFDGWKVLSRRQAAAGHPARWISKLSMDGEPADTRSRRNLMISIPSGSSVSVVVDVVSNEQAVSGSFEGAVASNMVAN